MLVIVMIAHHIPKTNLIYAFLLTKCQIKLRITPSLFLILHLPMRF